MIEYSNRITALEDRVKMFEDRQKLFEAHVEKMRLTTVVALQEIHDLLERMTVGNDN